MCTHMYTHICQSTFPLSTNSTSVLWSGPPWRSQVEFSPGMGWEWALKSGRNLIYIYHLLYVHKVNTYIILIWSPCEVCIKLCQKKENELNVVRVSHIWVSWPGQTPSFSPSLLQSHHAHISRFPSQSEETSERSRKKHCSVLMTTAEPPHWKFPWQGH